MEAWQLINFEDFLAIDLWDFDGYQGVPINTQLKKLVS